MNDAFSEKIATFRRCLFKLGLILSCINSLAHGQPVQKASITIDVIQPGSLIDARLWGTNLLQSANAGETVENPTFLDATRQMGIPLIRWPGGNNADVYDWMRDEVIRPGHRRRDPNGVNITRILQFLRDIGVELSITVNFGTMTPQDAADLVEFLNSPAGSEWGAQRAALGFPEPLNVRYFEIGNEENQPHMWYYSWTAENLLKYFFGGEEERRSFYDNSTIDADPVGTKGDFFKAGGGPNQTYTLRFPPVRDMQVYSFIDQGAAELCLRTYRQSGSIPIIPGQCEKWTEVADLSTQPPDAKVYTVDEDSCMVRFGDGGHGAVPPAGSYFLVEYTTYGHDGFLEFARAMRAVPSSVPIQIGAAELPFENGRPIAGTDSMVQIFQEMDFYVRHQYNSGIPRSAYGVYTHRRQIAADRLENLNQDRLRKYLDSIGVSRVPAIGVTEWNVFLDKDYWDINLTLEGGVIAAEWFIRLLNAGESAPVAYANQFALHGGNLALIRTDGNYSIAPMGYVFEGFKSWRGTHRLPVYVDSLVELAYDQTLPFINAVAAISPGNDTLFVAISNSAESETISCKMTINYFDRTSGRLLRLEGASYGDDHATLQVQPIDAGEADSILVQPHSVVFVELYGGKATSVDESHGEMPRDFELHQNYPNPFNPATTIRFSLPKAEHVTLKVFDVTGREVVTLVEGKMAAGEHQVIFEAGGLPSGMYFYQIQSGSFSQTRKAVLMR